MGGVPDLAGLYLATRDRIVGIVSGLGPAEEAVQVPATPEWNVHDVMAHLVGITEDALSGNMEGAPGDTWTAAQVARGKDRTLADLLAAWEANAPAVASVLPAAGELAIPAVLDIATHEQDLRGALGRPGARDNDVVRFAVPYLVEGWPAQLAAAGLPGVRVVTELGAFGEGEGAAVTLHASSWELFRGFFGRRSLAQVRAWSWDGDPGPVLDHFFVFGPATADLTE